VAPAQSRTAAAEADTPRIHPAILIAVNGFLALVSIAALFGIWFGHTGGR
jgi:putative membrane protein